MDCLAVVSTKGGVGKTTLSVHLAAAAQTEGRNVLIVDLDPQGSAAQWHKDRVRTFREGSKPASARLDCQRPYPNDLPDVLASAEAEGYDLVIIDTPPHADFPAARAAEVADVVLMPSRPSTLDLHAARATITLLRDLRKRAYFIINQALHTSQQTAEDAKAYLASKGIEGAPITITQLQPYMRALRDGLTAPEINAEGRPAAEIRALWLWVAAELRLARRDRAEARRDGMLSQDPFGRMLAKLTVARIEDDEAEPLAGSPEEVA